jgi:hypothetical protein
MPNKRTDNNDKQNHNATFQQRNDEVFIKELYDEVSQENQSQPSELLDQRIISAAHKAINKSNKLEKNKNLKWYSTLATAASLTLVISLVVLQQSNILPNEHANNIFKEGIAIQKPMASISDNASFAEQEIVAEEIDFQVQASYSAKPSQTPTPITNNTKMATKERMLRATQHEKQAHLTKQKSAEQMMALSPMFMPRLKKTESEIDKDKVQKDETETMYLSVKQLRKYTFLNKSLITENQWLWYLSSESDVEYIINIFQKNQQPLQYRLNKTIFNIVETTDQALTIVTLNNRNLSDIMIINR